MLFTDTLIHLRILSDERALRKVIKKFHTYVFASESGGVVHGVDDGQISLDEAREGLLAELATFHMTLQKSALVCQAEARQVVQYEKEKERIGEYGTSINHTTS
jgi:THO complex subunit 7